MNVYKKQMGELLRDYEKFKSLLREIEDIEEGSQGSDAWRVNELMAVRLVTFYSLVEKVFEEIAKEIDDLTLYGPSSDSKLLEYMSQSTSSRPVVIDEKLEGQLIGYLEFRKQFLNQGNEILAWNTTNPSFIPTRIC